MKVLSLIILIVLTGLVHSHGSTKHQSMNPVVETQSGEVTYLGNTGLMVSHGSEQVMFDPFFHNHYNNYQLVPEKIRTAIFDNKTPYESIEMILISHAHGDHFDANDLVKYLKSNPKTKLLAPTQAVDQLKSYDDFLGIEKQIHGIDLIYGDQPVEMEMGEIKVEVVRIPHAGWPGRADVSNLVYRVTLNNEITVMHMGDADPDDAHFKPWASYWEKRLTANSFPPYWFLTSDSGKQILSERINAKRHTGVHVPVKVPEDLKNSGGDFFSRPGEVFKLDSSK